MSILRWIGAVRTLKLLPVWLKFHLWLDRDHNWDYNLCCVNQVVFSPAAVRQFKRLPAAARSLLKSAVREQLADQDPREETRNRFRLRRVSEFADYELRVDTWRVFYRVRGKVVTIELIGQKKGNVLLIGRKEFKL